MTQRSFNDDPVPDVLMPPARVEWARGLGLAQGIRATPELDAQMEMEPCQTCRGSGRLGPKVRFEQQDGVRVAITIEPPPPVCGDCGGKGRRPSTPYEPTFEVKADLTTRTVAITPLKLVGKPIDGRSWIVLQLPGGSVRCDGTEDGCRAEARHLASTEAGEFAVFQPRGISRPVTQVTEELL